MARPATGSIEQRGEGKTLRWMLRTSVNGKRRSVTLHAADGHTRETAEARLAKMTALARIGIWEDDRPAKTEVPAARQSQPFGECAKEWWSLNRGRWRDNTRTDYKWRLNAHLLPFFGNLDVAQIKPRTIDEYTANRLAESERRSAAIQRGKPLRDEHGHILRPLSADTINKTLTLLGSILDYALEGELIPVNPYRVNTRNRKVPSGKPMRRHLDSADKIEAVLLAASQLDGEARQVRGNFRRAIVSTLIFGGLRVGELTALRWADVDLDNHCLRVEASKTDAGRRTVEILPALLADLTAWKSMSNRTLPSDFVFGTVAGGRYSTDNLRNRVMAPTVERASELLEAAGKPPLPSVGLTPHAMRRTCASLLVAVGWDPGRVMDQLGHTNPNLTMSVYRQSMNRSPEEKAALDLLVKGLPNHLNSASGRESVSR